jgi:hypothetical protein
MSRRYSIDGSRNVSSPTKSVLGLTSAASIRPEIYFMVLSVSATPGDNALQWLIQRYTAPGTNTAVTPQKIDPGDPVSLASAGENHTAEPTYTAGEVLLNVALNQRGTYPWYANEGAGLKLPAVANNGIGIQPVHSTMTGQVEATAHYAE